MSGPPTDATIGNGPDLSRARVLLVDDNRVNRNLLAAYLEQAGIRHVEQAQDGEEGLAKLESFRPDLVLLDLMMPRVDGFEMCRRLRADPRWASLPVLVQSNLNRAEDRASAFAAGATDYVSKPLNAVELLARVRIHLRKLALLNSLEQFRRRAASELELARGMQQRLMPPPERLAEIERTHRIGIAAHFAPSSELGGDFWGLQRLSDGQLSVHLVDFSGHGVGAALNTFRLHAICQQLAAVAPGAGFDPAVRLAQINRRLCPLLPCGQFATMLIGVIDPAAGLFRYASAGSTRPMVWGPGDRQPVSGDSAGLPLGLLAEADYEVRTLPLPPGGRLFLYSDAAVEVPVGSGVLDDDGLARLVADRLEITDVRTFLDAVLADLRSCGPIEDDLTALVLGRNP